MQDGEKFVLTITVDGTNWSVGRLAVFSKDFANNSAKGSGTLHEDGGSGSLDVAFEIDCC